MASLKILFDILDEEHKGLIRLRDVETRWSDEGVRDLPVGVMEGLRKVVPPNGLLSFECFVSGLKLALLQGREQQKRRYVSASGSSGLVLKDKENRITPGMTQLQASQGAVSSKYHSTSSSHPIGLHSDVNNRQQGSHALDANKRDGSTPSTLSNRSGPTPLQKIECRIPATAAVKPQPSNIGNASVHGKGNNRQYPMAASSSDQLQHNYPSSTLRGAPPPPRPERSRNPPQIRKSSSGTDLNPPQVPPRNLQQNQKIVNDLRNWQRDWADNKVAVPGGKDRNVFNDPNAVYENIGNFQGRTDEAQPQLAHGPGKATVRRHGSGRRHTLQNGVDHNMIKRMQQLDEESVMLQRGLEMVDVARDWYLRQLAAVQEKQKMLGKVNHNDYSLEAHQERMNFQRARISEVNMQLHTLVDSSEKGFPLHMNLAVSTMRVRENFEDASLKMVRVQNQRLTQEVSEKSEKISKLEQEKASLIRELFESRSKHKSAYDDTTFM